MSCEMTIPHEHRSREAEALYRQAQGAGGGEVGQLGLDGKVEDIAYRLVRLFEGDDDKFAAVLFWALSHLAIIGRLLRDDGTPTRMLVCDFRDGKAVASCSAY
jgi:hypothetical protein